MKALRVAGIPTLLVLCVGLAIGQDAAHDTDKAATKTSHVVKHATTKVGKATKKGAKDVCHGTKIAAEDTGKGVKTGTEKRQSPWTCFPRRPSRRRRSEVLHQLCVTSLHSSR
jgi:hypothetical protein